MQPAAIIVILSLYPAGLARVRERRLEGQARYLTKPTFKTASNTPFQGLVCVKCQGDPPLMSSSDVSFC